MPDRIERAVKRELGRFGPASGMAPVVEAWARAVGPEIARNAWPARLGRDGTLHVHASSSAWAFELGQLEPKIRDLLGPTAPPKLRFAVGPIPEPDPAASEARGAPATPGPRHLEEAEALAAGISDENLRKVVAKAAAASLARAESDRSF